ncbi:MAG: glycine--tRNA ligase subunit beta [Burkholderiales bacterium]|nr:glycine--tRNA ligase subunit beta [Burkholderiales bacterium]
MSTVISKPLLIELFTEELPPKALKKLGEAFAAGIEASLRADGLLAAGATVTSFATPRRLGARVDAVLSEAPAKAIKEKLMPLAVAKDAGGGASMALKKKLAASGREALAAGFPNASDGSDRLVVESDGKAEYVYLVALATGTTLVAGVQNAIDATLAKLPIPKVMTYQLADGQTDVNFVRPAHGLIVLHGDDVVPATTLGLEAGRIAHGHRFQGANNIELDTASRYEELLRQYGKVEPVFASRRDMILTQLEAKAKSLNATLGTPASYADLLDEVNSLVEWPTVYVCEFEPEFLAVPQECLILTMKTNQKYFPLFDAAGKLKNQFLIVSNMQLDNPKKIVEGNERVVRPRLADARFFVETDKKSKLEARVPELAKVVYHNKLGTQGERVARVSKLAGEIAILIGADKARAERGATLAKADLMTLMVGEFPELQGTMGRYYALHDGEAADVAAACAEHYQPRFAGDALPSAGVPTAVALADKLETLAGMFSIHHVPTGDKDPYALRRHAIGVSRILIEGGLSVSIRELAESAMRLFIPGAMTNEQFALEDFIYDRLRAYFRDGGFDTRTIQSVVDDRPKILAELPRRLAAVRNFADMPESASLSAANRRVTNILEKAYGEGFEHPPHPDVGLFLEVAEHGLLAALHSIGSGLESAYADQDYDRYLKSVASLKEPVDEFFDKVMVMADDKAVRANRLALLRNLRDAMNKVADLSKLAT